jgi:hypothetical protein
VCNEKCKHGLGRGFYLFNREIIYSIRLVPGSNPGQPTDTKRYMYRIPFFFNKILTKNLDRSREILVDKDI